MAKTKKVIRTKQIESVKKVPVGVQVASILFYISAGLCALLGLFFIIGANMLVSLVVDSTPEIASIITGPIFIIIGIILIGIGVLSFFVGRGLWKLKPWARILAIILAIVCIIYTVYTMIKSFAFIQIIDLIIGGFIAIYLIFGNEAKKAFK